MKIVIASGKGGVGKSMLASSLAILFAKNRQIAAVDCDVDAPNLHLWLGQTEDWDKIEKISTTERPVIDYKKCNGCGKCVDICQFGALTFTAHPDQNCSTPVILNLFQNLTGRLCRILNQVQDDTTLDQTSRNNQQLTINNFFCEGCGACEAICPQKAIRLEPVENAEIRFKQTHYGFPLVSAQLYPGETGSGKIVEEIKNRAEESHRELTILDSPAGTGCPVIAALKDSNFAVLVTEPTPSGFSDLNRVLTVINHFQIPFGVVINKWDINKNLGLTPEVFVPPCAPSAPCSTASSPPSRARFSLSWNKDLSDKIEKEFETQMLGKISYDKKIFEAISNLTPIIETDLPAKKEIEGIFEEIKSTTGLDKTKTKGGDRNGTRKRRRR